MTGGDEAEHDENEQSSNFKYTRVKTLKDKLMLGKPNECHKITKWNTYVQQQPDTESH